jgi:hypothetical protein
MTAKIQIQMTNAAFAENGGAELARILRGLADDVETAECADMELQGQRLRDFNGNTVGTFQVEPTQ